MKKALLIAEKPSLKRNIESAYKKYKSKIPYEMVAVAQVGHLFGLKMPNELDEDMDGWNLATYPWQPPKYTLKITDSSKKKIFDDIKKEILSDKYDFVIHAGDPDQEGELLIRETLLMARNKLPVKRLWVNGSTDEEFAEGLKNLRDDNEPFFENLYHSALARQKSDYLIGMNLSAVMGIKMNSVQNVGRLKTFICGLLAKRQLEIDNFVPSSIFNIKADNIFTSKDLSFDSEDECINFIKNLTKKGTITDVTTNKKTTYAPSLYKLSTLQIDGGKVGLSAKRVSDALQKLYEGGYVSYPRTSCEYISSNAPLEKYLKGAYVYDDLKALNNMVDIKRGKSKKYVNDEKVNSSGHVGLTPTGKVPSMSGWSDDMKKVYRLISVRYVCIFLPPLVEEKTTITLDIEGNTFVANGNKIVDKGYTAITSTPKKVEVPKVKKGDDYTVKEYKPNEVKKKCPSPYTDATLIKVLENPIKELANKELNEKGLDISIGQPSTRSATIDVLEKKDYIKREKKNIIPTSKCLGLISNLSGCFLVEADTTAKLEKMLENVRTGKSTDDEVLDNIKNITFVEVNRLKGISMKSQPRFQAEELCKCCFCGGTVTESKKAYGCSDCKSTLWKNNKFLNACGINLTKTLAKKLFTTQKAVVTLKSKQGNSYKKVLYMTKGEKWLEFNLKDI